MPQQLNLKEDLLFREVSTRSSSLYAPSQLMPYNPNELYQERGNYDLYDKMLLDENIRAILDLKKNIILSNGWEIRAEENQFQNEKKILEDNLNFWIEDSFDNILRQFLSALPYGFSLSEVIYDTDGSLVWIKNIKTRPPHSVLFFQDDFGNITKIVQQTKGFQELELNPIKFIRYSYQEEFQNPYGKSDLETCYRAYWAKDVIIRYWNIFLERTAVPPTIGKYKKTISAAIRERFLTLLENIQNKTSIVIPEDLTIELLEAKRSTTPDFSVAIDKYNLMIARGLLMPDLLGLSGEKTDGGSYSLGSKQFDMFMLVIKSIQKDLERVINNYLVRPFFKINWGIEEDYPQFKFKELTEDNTNELSRIWMDAVSKGVIIPSPEEKAHFRESLGYPDNPQDIEAPVIRSQQPFVPFKKEVYVRQPRTKVEKKYFSHIQKVNRLFVKEEEIAFDNIRPIVARMIEGLLDDVQKKKVLEKQKIEIVDTIAVKFKKDLQLALKTYLLHIFELGMEQIESLLSKKRKMQVSFRALTPAQYRDLFEQTSFWITGIESETMLRRVKGVLINALSLGKATKDTLFDLQESLSDFKESRLRTIIRNFTSKAYNGATLTASRDPDLEGFVEGFEYSAIIDDSTTILCEEMDGRQFKANDPYVDEITPPNHHNAILPDVLIKAKRGDIPIKELNENDFVLTHNLRWKKISSISRRPFNGICFKINSAFFTPDHPILCHRGWIRAQSLMSSDMIFKNVPNSNRVSQKSFFINPYKMITESISKVDFSLVRDSTFVAPVVFSEDFYDKISNDKIANPLIQRNLEFKSNIMILEHIYKEILRGCRMLTKILGINNISLNQPKMESFLINISESFGSPFEQPAFSGAGNAFSGDFRSNYSSLEIKRGPFSLRSVCDAIMPQSIAKLVHTRISEIPSNRTKTFSHSVMFNTNQLLKHFFGFNKHEQSFNFKYDICQPTIEEFSYQGDVYDISVENDETYFANDLLVHNCRSILIPITIEDDFEESRKLKIEADDPEEPFGFQKLAR